MSNTDNIYNILNNFNKIAKEEPAPVAATPKAKTKLQESMEQVVNEKYMGFKKTVAAIKKSGSAKDPEAVAAAIGRKKHGKEKFQKAAATGKKLSEDHGPENPDALVNYGEYDREGDMAKDDLYTIDNAAEELYSILRTDDNLPEWVQKKITLAVDYLDTARDYMKAQSYGQGVAEGMVKGEYGRVLDALGLYYPRLSMEELNVPGYHKVVADKANVPVEYVAQVINDFTRDNDPDEDEFNDDEQGVAEGTNNLHIPDSDKMSDKERHKAILTKHPEATRVGKTPGHYRTKDGDLISGNRGVRKLTKEQDVTEGFDDMIKDVNRKAKEQGTGKFDKKEISTGTVYTRKYNPKSGETDDTENVSTEKRGRGRPKKSAFEDMSTIDKMIAEAFGELFEGTSRPINDPVSKAAPTTPGVGSGIRVTPMPALATTPKPAIGMGTIKGGVFTATPPKPGEQGVAIPQGLDEVDAEMEGMRKLAGLKGGQKKLDRDHDGELTRKDFEMLRKGLEEGGTSMPGDQYLSIPADQTKLSLGQRMARDGITYSGDNEREMIGIIAKYMKDQGESSSTIRYYMNDDDFVADALSDLRAASSQKPDYKSKMQDKFGGSAEDLTRGLSIQGKKVEEGGRDDYDEIRDKIQWLQGAPNYLSRDEAKETAYYTKDTDPVWDGYRDDDEISERVTIGPDGKVTGGLQPSTAPDTPEQAARRQQSLQAYQAQQQAQNKPPSFASDVDSAKKGLYMQPGDNTVYSGTRGPGPSMAADRLEKRGVDIPGLVGNRVNPDNIVDEVDDMEEGNVVTGAMADKTIPVGAPIPGTNLKKTKHLDTMAEGDAALNQMRRIAGLKEGGMSPISGMASDMQKQQGNMNISTSQSSDGTKSVTITAAGDAASDLMQMLKLAGMGGGGAAPTPAEPEIVLVQHDSEETMEEEKDPRYQASTTPDEQVAPIQALTKGGNGDVAGQEKTMKPGGYQFGDNNLAMKESFSAQLMKEYNSLKVKK